MPRLDAAVRGRSAKRNGRRRLMKVGLVPFFLDCRYLNLAPARSSRGRGSVIETEASDERAVEPPRVQAGNGSEDRDHGADRLPDSGSMGGRLAEAGEEARSGEPADPGVEGPSGAGGGGDLADAKHEPLGAARDHANVRDRPRTA